MTGAGPHGVDKLPLLATPLSVEATEVKYYLYLLCGRH